MIEAAWKWAAKTSNLRKNEIHGEEEARLCLSDEFQLLDEEGQEICMQGALELDDARMQQYMCMYTHMYMSIAIDSYNIPDSTYIYIHTHTAMVFVVWAFLILVSAACCTTTHWGSRLHTHMYVKVLR